MLTKDKLIELFSNTNRRLFLGDDIYEKCKRDGRKVSNIDLQKRLDFWKNNKDFNHMFKRCNVNDVVRICNFSADKPVDDILDNVCYQDINSNINYDIMQEASSCSICYEYNKNGEIPNKIGCGHYFHYSCLNEWMGTGKTTCPMCREPINMLLGFPTQNNQDLFKTIQKIDKTFVRKYLDEMKLFMTNDEIMVFKQLHNIDIDEKSIKDRIFLFLLTIFIWNLIAKAQQHFSGVDYMAVEEFNYGDVVLFPTSTYAAFQFLMLAFTVFKRVLDKFH